MNVVAAVVAGLVASGVFSMVLALAPRMGMPKMDIVGLMGSMFGRENRVLGWIMHVMMAMVFGLVYALLWSRGILSPNWLGGLAFGAAQWILVGMIMGLIPMMHAGIRSGAVKAPGLWMTNEGGAMAFFAGLMGHMIFGVVLALVYSAL